MLNRKIAIIGSAHDPDIPISKDWELWGCNNLYLSGNLEGIKFSRWFELHDIKFGYKTYLRRNKPDYGLQTVEDYLKGIADLKIPTYMQQKWAIIPKSRIFPFEKLIKKFGSYFGCSFAWQTALAIYEHLQGKKVDTIGYFGILLEGHEYYRQRPSTEYLIGWAKGLGIKVEVSKTSLLLKSDMIYAYKEDFDKIDRLYGETTRDFVNHLALWVQYIRLSKDENYG